MKAGQYNDQSFPVINRSVPDEAAMEALGMQLGKHGQSSILIYLQGDLGAGKTTLARGFLRGMGYTGKVKSPTYTLVEPYDLGEITLYHFDLYRINNPAELETIGIRDYLDGTGICLFEWPEKAVEILPIPDIQVDIKVSGSGRLISMQALNAAANNILKLAGFHQKICN
jgi:tRNA threonylcarbamoyladenosine biosynthesis protein TsaE